MSKNAHASLSVQAVHQELLALRNELERLKYAQARWSAVTTEIVQEFAGLYRRRSTSGARNTDRKAIGPRVLLPLTLKEDVLGGVHDEPREIWMTLLAARDIVLTVEIKLVASDTSRLSGLVADVATAVDDGGELRLAVNLFGGEPKCLVKVLAGVGVSSLSVRRLRGPLSIARLEVREVSARSDDVSPASEARSVSAVRNVAGSARESTLWTAQQMVRDGRGAEALEFALAHASVVERPAVDLLRAGIGAIDDATWLWYVNRYVATFEIAPIDLGPDDGTPRFLRLLGFDLPLVPGPMVTVIMPAFNAAATLALAARSILNQTWQSLELIIVDDCSTDDTWSIAEGIARTDDRVRVQRNAINVGPYVSKNLVLAAARGQYLTCHDADDWAHPQRLELQMAALQKAGRDVQACVGGMLRLDENGVFTDFSKIGDTSHDGALRLAHVSCLINTDFFRRVIGSWDSVRFGADGEMLERLAKVLGPGLLRLRQLAAFCLDAESGLTNDPRFGISAVRGLSPVRRTYRDQWRAWHAEITPDSAYLPFPQDARPFSAPEECVVPSTAVKEATAGMSMDVRYEQV